MLIHLEKCCYAISLYWIFFILTLPNCKITEDTSVIYLAGCNMVWQRRHRRSRSAFQGHRCSGTCYFKQQGERRNYKKIKVSGCSVLIYRGDYF